MASSAVVPVSASRSAECSQDDHDLPMERGGLPGEIQILVLQYFSCKIPEGLVLLETEAYFYDWLNIRQLGDPYCNYQFRINLAIRPERVLPRERQMANYNNRFTPAEHEQSLREVLRRHNTLREEIPQQQQEMSLTNFKEQVGIVLRMQDKIEKGDIASFHKDKNTLIGYADEISGLISTAAKRNLIPAEVGANLGSLDTGGRIAAVINWLADREYPQALQRIEQGRQPPYFAAAVMFDGVTAVDWEVEYFNRTFICPVFNCIAYSIAPKFDQYRARFSAELQAIPAFPPPPVGAPAAAAAPAPAAAPPPAPAPVAVPAPAAAALPPAAPAPAPHIPPPPPPTSWQSTLRFLHDYRRSLLSVATTATVGAALLSSLTSALLVAAGFTILLPLFSFAIIAGYRRFTQAH